jgi:hypothetical protein
MGTGWLEAEHAAYGFPFPPLGERMDVLEEQLQIVAGHWADGPFSFHGRHYAIDELDALPKPVQRPRPPLIMGGGGGGAPPPPPASCPSTDRLHPGQTRVPCCPARQIAAEPAFFNSLLAGR